MKVVIASSAVPLVNSGARFIVDWLHEVLLEHGHQAETAYIPYVDSPSETLSQMAAYRMLKIENADRVITFRPPAHLIEHPNKVVWFIHHLRHFYDLWDTEYRGLPDRAPYRATRDLVRQADTAAMKKARHLFTNSKTVSQRLLDFNGLPSEVLYPPVLRPERFVAGDYGDEIVCICRLEDHKRQHLLAEAMRHVRTGVKLRLCGLGRSAEYLARLRSLAEALPGRILIEERWISEAEKIDWLSTALAAAYVPFDEDSYGYPTIEAAHARRCTVTLSDAGGVPEFVTHGETGIVADPDPKSIAEAFDRLYVDRKAAARLGEAAEGRIGELRILWPHVLERLLA